MKWNVFYYDINRRKINTFNIFEHGSFYRYIQKHLSDFKTKESFGKRLKSELMYYFWAKSEWEILISPWCGGDRERDAVKVDVYEQVMQNFDVFLDYTWNHRDEIGENDV